jgi:hypothetical protein
MSSIDEWIGTEVERSFAEEPPLRDPREFAARGHRAQRRRRAATSVLGIGAVAVVAALTVSGLHPGTGQRGAPPAGGGAGPVRGVTELPVDPTTERQCTRQPAYGCDPAIGWDDLHSDANGDLVRGHPDVEVTGRYDDIYSPSYRASSALEVRRGDHVAWLLVTWSRSGLDGGVSIDIGCPDPTRTFDQWVADSYASQLGGAWRGYACAADFRGQETTQR